MALLEYAIEPAVAKVTQADPNLGNVVVSVGPVTTVAVLAYEEESVKVTAPSVPLKCNRATTFA